MGCYFLRESVTKLVFHNAVNLMILVFPKNLNIPAVERYLSTVKSDLDLEHLLLVGILFCEIIMINTVGPVKSGHLGTNKCPLSTS